MKYSEICTLMDEFGWDAHGVLCSKIKDPFFNRKGTNFCTVSNVKQLDTYQLFQQMGKAPDTAEWVGESATLVVYNPKSGGGATRHDFKAWVYREKGIVEYIKFGGVRTHAALSDVEQSLVMQD